MVYQDIPVKGYFKDKCEFVALVNGLGGLLEGSVEGDVGGLGG